MSDFSKFNKTLTAQEQAAMNQVRNRIVGGNRKKADYPEPVNGVYIAQVDRLEIAPKQDTGVPCFYLCMKLIDGAEPETIAFLKGWPGTGCPKIFRKLPLAGTKNDAKCIGSVTGLASRFHENTQIMFNGDYDQLAEDIAALRQKIDDSYAYLIEYDRQDFNHITIQEILRNNVDEPEPVLSEAVPGNAQQVPETNRMPQFDSDGFIPMEEEEDFLPPGIQKPTSYPFPDSGFTPGIKMDELENFNEGDELPF